jgi:signal transduction histidine kinase/truncated hemoglobin YjbI
MAMDTWEEMKEYVGWGTADEARLRGLVPLIEPHLDALTDSFYAAVLRFPGARAVLANDAQVLRLKGSLRRFLLEMLSGPWDAAYAARRKRVGEVHVRVGLPERYVFTAMNLLRQEMCGLVHAAHGPGEAWPLCQSVNRIADLELALLSAAYMEAHEQRQLRSLQDLIVQNLPVTVICLDADGRVTSATRPSTRVFGDFAEIGRHYEVFLPEELVEAADLPTAVGRALATGHEVNLPRVQLGHGATARHLRITLVPLEHPLARLLIHIEELTDVVQAEVRVQQSESLARIGGLAAHMAHEIRNPLAAISATLQVIVGSLPADDRRKPILGKVQDQVHRLDRLVTDLLGYARPALPRLQPAALGALVADGVAQAGVAAAVELCGDRVVLVDPQHVHQILVNLLHNARDAAGEGGTVVVSVGPGAEIAVEDDGPGLDPAVAERLFEPFVTSKTRGTGLGLAISRKLAAAMGGCLEWEAPARRWPAGRGPGARFRLSLSEAG